MNLIEAGQTADDVGAVQSAVDGHDPDVVLKGTFDFEYNRETGIKLDIRNVIVTKHVSISADPGGATIQGGGWISGPLPSGVFDIDAAGQSVIIRGLHFDGPSLFAIRIPGVGELTIDGCVIKNVRLGKLLGLTTATGILVGTRDPKVVPRATSGMLTITNNQIDMMVNSAGSTLGILLNNAGMSSTKEVEAHITGNKVTNVTAFGIDFRALFGSAYVEGTNVISMGTTGDPTVQVSGIRCLGSGNHTIRGNRIDCGYENAGGIRLQTAIGATVESNAITMSRGGDGVELSGSCHKNTISGNTILGVGRAALLIAPELSPDSSSTFPDNSFVWNEHADFGAYLAQIVVGNNVTNTKIDKKPPTKEELLAPPIFLRESIIDEGQNTVITGNYRMLSMTDI